MFHEYAVEPGVISSWESARFYLDAFGASKGRFLSEFPRDWQRRMYAGLTCNDVEKKRIQTRLEHAKKNYAFFRRRGAAYDDAQSWLANANAQHAVQAFRAIIVASSPGAGHVVNSANLDESEPTWNAPMGMLVARRAAAFGQALDLLLRACSTLAIVDPHFRAEQKRKTAPLEAFCARVGSNVKDVHLHVSAESRSYNECMTNAERSLGGSVPKGVTMHVHCWAERAGARFHNRYVLTNVGGVQFGDSIEEGEHGQQDRLSILDHASHLRLWDEFMGPSPVFVLAGEVKRIAGQKVPHSHA